MFCENCGAKNEQDATFCIQCGKKLLEPGEKTPLEIISPMVRRPIPLKQKVMFSAVIVVILLGSGLYALGAMLSNPKRIAEDYFTSITEKDYKKAYNFLDIAENEFATEDLYVKMMENTSDNGETGEILNYKIKEIEPNELLDIDVTPIS